MAAAASADAVFEHHLAAFGAGDLEEILVDYTDATVMIHNEHYWRGLDGARAYFARWLDELLPAGSRFDLIDRQVTDDLVFITWTAESPHYVFDYGTDTFLIEHGKVVRQTVATLHRRK